MFYYEGLNCPVCDQPFVDGDDIVVCPQCGLPHHRACWAQSGQCFEESKHGTTEQWSRQNAQRVTDEAQDASLVHCPHCHAENSEGINRCIQCGYPLNEQAWQSAHAPNIPYGGYAPRSVPSVESYSSAEKIGSSNAADLAAVVGNNTTYYMDRFRRIERGQGGGWNWAAFLLAPFWLFYRKQYLLGAVYLIIRLVSNIATLVVFAPFYVAETIEQQEAMLMDIYASPLFYLAGFLYVIFMTLKILLGLRANSFYLEHCEKKIHTMRMKTPDISPIELASFGGVSFALPILFYLVTELALTIVNYLVGIV